jgi:NADPH2:quinone reductase
MKAMVADPVGGVENLKYEDLPQPEPKQGQALIKVEAAGVNFIDIYFRTGFYKAPETPVLLGSEGAGTVVASGPGTNLTAGSRVAWAMSRGAYAEYAVVPASNLVTIPDAVSFESAAAVMLQGMTAHYLTRSAFPLQAGQTCLVHAAAGGAGLSLVQLAKLAGARVIGTASTPEKIKLAKNHGADEMIQYTEKDFVEEVKRMTTGKGVDVVYDSVGSTTFHKSLDCLRPRGMMVTFGQSSGPVGPIDPLILNQKGSLFLTRPSLGNYISERKDLEWRASDLFQWLAEKRLATNIYKVYPLADAAQAHQDLEGRKTTGKLLLKP